MREQVDKCLDSHLWHACAGSMVKIPQVNTKVFYFPQGHAEHTLTNVDFTGLPRIPPMILCRVASVKYLADNETDEVYTKMKLVPMVGNDLGLDDMMVSGSNNAPEIPEKSNSFTKTLTQSDANNGGGFSVPRYCAETIFPPLDFSADPPVQNVYAKDVHGETWKFRHIYRGTPRRHLLTTGWSSFVNHKNLVAGDSIVFMRTDDEEIFVGIRRAKKDGNGGSDASSGWSTASGSYSGRSPFLREDDSRGTRSGTSSSNLNSSGGGFRQRGRVKPEAVREAAYLAASGKTFEIVYYPRASTPEYCVKASSVYSAMRINWCARMRFKMAFDTEDCARISWFMGTISSIRVLDPIHWPNSPWRVLQVTWDEPDLLQNVKHVSPWMIELVSNMPTIDLSPFSPPRKKLCLPQDFSLDSQFQIPAFSGNALGASSLFSCVSNNIAAGIQGARQAPSFCPSLDLQLSNKMHLGMSSSPNLQQIDADSRIPDGITKSQKDKSDITSCSLTIGNSNQKSDKAKTINTEMTPRFLLFGQPILTEQQMSHHCSTSSSATNLENQTSHSAELGIDNGHCRVFLDSENVSQTLDPSVLGSYEELYKKLAKMFGIQRSEMVNHVMYHDATGAVIPIGSDPFSEFIKKAKRLTIMKKTGSSSKKNPVD